MAASKLKSKIVDADDPLRSLGDTEVRKFLYMKNIVRK